MARESISFSLLDSGSVGVSDGDTIGRKSPFRHYKSLDYWKTIARDCERAGLDAHIISDFRPFGSGDAGQVVLSVDPAMIIAAMASVTSSLGFVIDCNLATDIPFSTARRFSSLDHFSKGRIGANLRFSAPVAGGAFDAASATARDEEFLEVCYKLWESSWEDDAVVRNVEDAIYAEPSKVHRIEHKGTYFSCAGPHLCEPSRQRTPTLFHIAGGQDPSALAVRHAETLVIGGRTPDELQARADRLRRLLLEAGRSGETVRILALYAFVTGETPVIVKEKQALAAKAAAGPGDVLHACGTPDEVADHIATTAASAGLNGFVLCGTSPIDVVGDFANFIAPALERRELFGRKDNVRSLREAVTGSAGMRLGADHPAMQHRL